MEVPSTEKLAAKAMPMAMPAVHDMPAAHLYHIYCNQAIT